MSFRLAHFWLSKEKGFCLFHSLCFSAKGSGVLGYKREWLVCFLSTREKGSKGRGSRLSRLVMVRWPFLFGFPFFLALFIMLGWMHEQVVITKLSLMKPYLSFNIFLVLTLVWACSLRYWSLLVIYLSLQMAYQNRRGWKLQTMKMYSFVIHCPTSMSVWPSCICFLVWFSYTHKMTFYVNT